MKLLYLVLDGAADSLSDERTSYEMADTPALDSIAEMGVCGLMYPIEKGLAPESDSAVFSILGYDPHKYYTGRGPIEALGAGLKIREGYEVAFRANFATVKDYTKILLDRRAGRSLRTDEARRLAQALDSMELGLYDGYARVVATVGHRAVVIIGSKTCRLSANVSNTDPAYEKRGAISVARPKYEMKIEECVPLDDTPEAKRTAELVNLFTERAIEILCDHPINRIRERKNMPKANAILLRDAGDRLPKVELISEKFGISAGAVAEMPVEIGIARLLGMDVASVPPPTPDKRSDYAIRLDAAFRLMETHDMTYVHLKGPDEPGHDGDFDEKIRAIEAIDRYFVKPFLDRADLENTAILITSDHATPCSARAHTGDPVPVVLYAPGQDPDPVKKLTEKECAKGSLGIIEHGWELLPLVLKRIGMGRV